MRRPTQLSPDPAQCPPSQEGLNLLGTVRNFLPEVAFAMLLQQREAKTSDKVASLGTCDLSVCLHRGIYQSTRCNVCRVLETKQPPNTACHSPLPDCFREGWRQTLLNPLSRPQHCAHGGAGNNNGAGVVGQTLINSKHMRVSDKERHGTQSQYSVYDMLD